MTTLLTQILQCMNCLDLLYMPGMGFSGQGVYLIFMTVISDLSLLFLNTGLQSFAHYVCTLCGTSKIYLIVRTSFCELHNYYAIDG